MLINLFYLVIGLLLITWSADKFTEGASAVASNFGVPPIIVGLTIVAIGTSAPEIAVSFVATFNGNPNIAIGNALGSNIANVALVLGITALVQPILVDSGVIRREFPVMFAVIIVTGLVSLNFILSPADFVILITLLVAYLAWLTGEGMKARKQDPMIEEVLEEIPKKISSTKASLFLLIGLVLLPVSSKLLVLGASGIARMYGISELVIGLSIIAVGTSLPELAAAIASVLKKENALAVGNIIGSNIFNLLAVYSVPGLVTTQLSETTLYRDFLIMALLSVVLFFMVCGFNKKPGKITRLEGGILLTFFIGYQFSLYYT